MARRKIKVARDHVQRLASATPLKAVEELIWNGLDAGGPGVEIRLFSGPLGVVDRLQVVDQGSGISVSELERAFGTIGNSPKASQRTNAEGRLLHGREGRGRFKALALGPTATWTTTYREGGRFHTYCATVRRDNPDYFETSEPVAARTGKTGTVVEIPEIDRGESTLAREEMRAKLAETFAPYLSSYPTASITYDGRLLKPDDFIERQTNVWIESPDEPGGGLRLIVVEWRFKPDAKRLHICDERGFSFHEVSAGVQGRGIEYTAYLCTPLAPKWAEGGRFVSGDQREQDASG